MNTSPIQSRVHLNEQKPAALEALKMSLLHRAISGELLESDGLRIIIDHHKIL
jgi:hypothetical protein